MPPPPEAPEAPTRKVPKLRDPAKNAQDCKAYIERIKADPVKLAAYRERKRRQSRENYQRLKSKPGAYEALLEKAAKQKRDRMGWQERPRTPNKGRALKRMTKEERSEYGRKRIVRELAREHAFKKKLDLYTVYQQWGCVFTRDYPGMRNPFATKRAQTNRTLEAIK